MSSHPTSLDALKRLWCRWTDLVRLFAQRRPARLKIRPQDYQKLREEVLTLCEALADAADDPQRAAYYRGLADLVRPFLTPAVLARTDGEILFHLWTRCQQIDQELTPRPWRRTRSVAWIALPLVLGAVAFALVLELGGVAIRTDWAPIAWLRLGWALLRLTVHRLSDLQKEMAVGVLVVMAVIVVIRRYSRD
jgi:hypothetical protein